MTLTSMFAHIHRRIVAQAEHLIANWIDEPTAEAVRLLLEGSPDAFAELPEHKATEARRILSTTCGIRVPPLWRLAQA